MNGFYRLLVELFGKEFWVIEIFKCVGLNGISSKIKFDRYIG